MIDRYTHLANDFAITNQNRQINRSRTRSVRRQTQQIRLFNFLPNHLWPEIQWRTLCEQNRFLSSGSPIVLWLRNQHRYQEVVDFMMPLKEDWNLCFETQNGFYLFSICRKWSVFLIVKIPSTSNKHQIDRCLGDCHLVDSGRSLYALGCVASRAGQTKRALDYIERAVEGGQSISYMMKDLDLKTSGTSNIYCITG